MLNWRPRKYWAKAGVNPEEIKAIGLSYQMHGLVVVDRSRGFTPHAIIWCDRPRAARSGDRAFANLGEDACLARFLNSPGNFAASN